MPDTRITVRQAISKVSEMDWISQKNGVLSIKNAEVFGSFYGFENFLNDLATENVRSFKHFWLRFAGVCCCSFNRTTSSPP